MRVHWLALLCWVMPTLAVVITYTISAATGQVPTCFPFLEGCTSISGAARRDPSIHVFRGMMLPTATVIAAYWILVRHWLGHLGDRGRGRDWITGLGVIGALFLVFYVVFLGTEGDAYEFMRRYGVTVYFAFTALAQLLLAYRLRRLPAGLEAAVGTGLVRAKVGFCGAMLLFGLVNVPAKNFFPEWPVDNMVAWNFALLMHGYFGLTAVAWRRAGYRLTAAFAAGR
ncbi:hypothetical protein [Thioalkalivibrio sp. XN8]|uniref:hypothetical protein n=1 Tax=Thioalkalivibrio sp. XN8 TaxID=2712863 RepID=UPI0013ECE6A9|nr:hypothetical protein [Thioalkalivibrio sp. XN8]NGP54185.1 hypothetical protein [Thioalkalivibrio sp. XN8]